MGSLKGITSNDNVIQISLELQLLIYSLITFVCIGPTRLTREPNKGTPVCYLLGYL